MQQVLKSKTDEYGGRGREAGGKDKHGERRKERKLEMNLCTAGELTNMV